MTSQEYRYEVKSVDGFLSQVVRYVACGGHYFYIRVRVPEGKDPRAVAKKLLDRYDIRLYVIRNGRRDGSSERDPVAGKTASIAETTTTGRRPANTRSRW